MVKFSITKKLQGPQGVLQLHVACDIAAGKFVGLYGDSGAGKTSILRMLGGFMQPDDGEITCNGEVWYSTTQKISTPPQKRNIGFVFQDYGLFPNMNVRQTLLFALQKGEPVGIVDELLALTGLEGLQKNKIHTLSGGEEQRMTLARALVRKPALLLLDEPLSAIDNALRASLQYTLAQLHRQYKVTTLLVSHDIQELAKLCDTVICLEAGVVKQHAAPAEIFFANNGDGCTLTGTVLGTQQAGPGFVATVLVGGNIVKIPCAEDLPKGQTIQLGLQQLV